jgi:iron complex outermembrane recepter protein
MDRPGDGEIEVMHGSFGVRLGLVSALASASLIPFMAYAQPAPIGVETDPESEAADQPGGGEIIVTGTLLRGIAPTGTNVIGVNSEEIEATGATSTNDLLASIPQNGTFNAPPSIPSGVNNQSTNFRPRLRDLGSPYASGAATLVLLDGHRFVGMGIRQTTPDPDIIPPSIIERVEVIPDGGSSIYGSDAVAGVINFITRRRVSGITVEGRYALGDEYQKVDTSLTVGQTWGMVSAYAAYNFTWNDDILGIDRDYVQRLNWATGQRADVTCNPGNITLTPVGGVPTTYALPGRVAGTVNRCDTSDFAAFWPEMRRHSVFAGVSLEGETVQFDVRGFYAHRLSRARRGPLTTPSASITPANPFYVDIPGATTTGRTQTVAFDWSPVFGNDAVDDSTLEAWGVTPTMSIDMGSGWQLRWLANYGRSTSINRNTGLNTTLLNSALAGMTSQTAINPYDVASTPNKQLLQSIGNYLSLYAEAQQELINTRLIVDGSLLSLPGGDMRVAAGTEYIRESFKSKSGNGVPGFQDALNLRGAHRHVYSAFGELYIPIFGPGNAGPGHESLVISASGRYDNYSDFGSTFNPKIGVTYKPFDGLTFKGNWGTSFQAPGLADSRAAVTTLSIIPFPIIPNPFQPPVASNQPYLAIQGGGTNLRPQTATTYSFGADIEPAFAPGLRASLTYFNIDFKDLVDTPPLGQASNFFRFYTGNFIMNPTEAQVLALISDIPGAPTQFAGADLYAAGKPAVYAIVDIRRTNLSRVKLDGLDFSVSYARETSFGAIDASVSGTYQLNRKTQPVVTLPFSDDLAVGTSRFGLVAKAGADIGNFRAQVTWYHNAGYKQEPIATNNFQDKIDAFNVVDLFFKYDVPGTGMLQDLTLTLNVNNVFNAEPPVWQTFDFVNFGYTNGFTLGRVVQLGVKKQF